MALTQEEKKLKEANEKLTDRVEEFNKLIAEQTLNQQNAKKELKKVAEEDVEEREKIKNNLSEIESELKDLNIKKTFAQITGGLQASLDNAVKIAGSNIVKSSEDVKKQTLQRIIDLATTEKNQVKAFELLREAIDDRLIETIDEFADNLGEEGENFVKTFNTFEKNVEDLERQQVNLRRQGLAFEVDILNNRLIPIRENVVKEEQRRYVNLVKETDRNDRELKILARKKNELTDFELQRIDILTKRQEEIIDLQQEIKDKGIKVRRDFEKSIFIPQRLTEAFNDFFENQRAFLGGKSIKERGEELGEFFDGITPAPIQDLFRGLTTAISPAINTIKELLKPFKLIPFLGMKVVDLFSKNSDAIEENTKEQKKAGIQDKKIKTATQKEDKKLLQAKKEETKEGKERFPLLKKIGNTFKNMGRFVFALPGILISLVLLGGVVLLFRKTLLELGRKFGLFKTEGEEADKRDRKDAVDDFREMLKEKGIETTQQDRKKYTRGSSVELEKLAKRKGVEDTKEFKRLFALRQKQEQVKRLGFMEKDEEEEREQFQDLESSILKDQSQLQKLQRQLEEDKVLVKKKSGRTPAIFRELSDEEKQKKRDDILKIEQSIEEQSKRLSKEFADVEAAEEKIVKQGELINNTSTTINNNTQSTIGFMRDNKDGSFMQNLIFKGFF